MGGTNQIGRPVATRRLEPGFVRTAVLLQLLTAMIGCGSDVEPPAIDQNGKPRLPLPSSTRESSPPATAPVATVKPIAPIHLSPPVPPNASWNGKDLSKTNGAVLARAARQAAQKGKYADAATLQHWAVVANDDGRYDLACYCSRAGNVAAAIYWLQEAALSDGVDSAWAKQDFDLAAVRSDHRWAHVNSFLDAMNRYWAKNGQPATTYVMPQDLPPQQSMGVLLGLHGLGANPESFFNNSYQPFADRLALAFVGVSGTVPCGRSSYVWAEDIVRDAERVRQALRDAADRHPVDRSRVTLLGFSQGAQMAFEIAMTYPETFSGAIVLSPGSKAWRNLAGLRSDPFHRRQAYVFCCGENEHPRTVTTTRNDAESAEKIGAKTQLLITPGMRAHTFPPNSQDRLPEWIRFIEEQRTAQPNDPAA